MGTNDNSIFRHPSHKIISLGSYGTGMNWMMNLSSMILVYVELAEILKICNGWNTGDL